MNKKRWCLIFNKKGFALLTVILLGVLVTASIIGVYIKLVPEKNIFVARADLKRALSAVEACVSQVLFDLRNTNFEENKIYPEGADHYLTIDNVKNIIKSPIDSIITLDEKTFSENPLTTYQLKIKRLYNPDPEGFNDVWDPDTGQDFVGSVLTGIYALGTVYKDASKSSIIARKAIYSEIEIVYKKEIITSIITIEEQSKIFDYALFSGSDIYFNGNAQTANGNIFANGNIDLGPSPSKTRVINGSAIAHGTITGKGKVDKDKLSTQPEIPFPMINKDYYKQLAINFKNGVFPYDGTKSDFPNTNDNDIKNIIQYYLGTNISTSLNDIQTFYSDLKNKTGQFATLDNDKWLDLKNKSRSIVYYLEGDQMINGRFEAEGTFVIDGDLIINGNSEIINPGGLAFIVDGNINRANGNAHMEGLFYGTGSITGIGTFDCDGAIVTKGSINLNGTFDVRYQQITNMPTLSITTTVTTQDVENLITKAEKTSSSWKEISFDVFNSAL